MAYEAVKIHEAADKAAEDVAVPEAAPAPKVESKEPILTVACNEMGDLPYDQFARWYTSDSHAKIDAVAIIGSGSGPFDLNACQSKANTAMEEEKAAELAFLEAKQQLLDEEKSKIEATEYSAEFEKRGTIFPYRWEPCTVTVAKGLFTWETLPQGWSEKAKEDDKLHRGMLASGQSVSVLGDSGSWAVGLITGISVPQYMSVPVQAYGYRGEVMELQATTGDCYQLRSLPYRLTKLKEVIETHQKAAAAAEAAIVVAEELSVAQQRELKCVTLPPKEAYPALLPSNAGSAFVQAVKDNDYYAVRDYLDHGADGNLAGPDDLWISPLSTAVKYGDSHLRITQLLLDRCGHQTDLEALIAIAERHCNMETAAYLRNRGLGYLPDRAIPSVAITYGTRLW